MTENERAWTLPAAAGLAAIEATVAIAVLLYGGHAALGLYVGFLAAKYPICLMVVRRQAWAFLGLLLWEFSVGVAALLAPRIPLALRAVELMFAGTVIGLLFASLHLFPRAQLPRR